MKSGEPCNTWAFQQDLHKNWSILSIWSSFLRQSRWSIFMTEIISRKCCSLSSKKIKTTGRQWVWVWTLSLSEKLGQTLGTWLQSTSCRLLEGYSERESGSLWTWRARKYCLQERMNFAWESLFTIFSSQKEIKNCCFQDSKVSKILSLVFWKVKIPCVRVKDQGSRQRPTE